MVTINNDAGETVHTAPSKDAAVRWWIESGRGGDYIAETDELLRTVADELGIPRYETLRERADRLGISVDEVFVRCVMQAEVDAEDAR